MKSLDSWMLGYLFNSLWQIPLLFAVAWVVARALRGLGTAIEYRVWVIALLLQSLLPACPAVPARYLFDTLAWIVHRSPARAGEVSVVIGAGAEVNAIHLPLQILTVLTCVYGLILLYFAARLLWRLRLTLAISRRSKPLALHGEIASYWKNCCVAFGLDDAQIATSHTISSPMTMGVSRRIILLPEGMIDRLPDEDVTAIIAHEFAHMRRRDYAWNLLFELLSLPAAYHPVLWLTRSRLVESREMVCDEIAADAGAGRDKYVRSLLRLASLIVRRTPAVAPHAIGIFDANTFERRIMKLTTDRKELRGTRRILILAACALCGLGTCVSAMALRTNVYLPYADKAATSEQKKITVSPGVMAGHIRSKVNPTYPAEAKASKIQGQVVLHAVISKDGTVENLQVVSGPQRLASSALDAVRQWVYEPYVLNGNPVEVETNITVTYSLSK